MDKNTPNIKVVLAAALITFLLYNSGFLVVLTPFPFLFTTIMYGKRVGKSVAFATFALALLTYLFIWPLFHSLSETSSLAKLVYIIPGAGAAETFGPKSVILFGLLYLAYFFIFGYFFAQGCLKKRNIGKLLTKSVGYSFGFAVLVFILLQIMGFNLYEKMGLYMQHMVDEIIKAQEVAGVANEQAFLIKRDAKEIIALSLSMMPAGVFLFSLFVGLANFVLLRWMVRTPEKLSFLGDTKKFSLPHQLVWFSIAVGFLFFVERYLLHINGLSMVLLNVVIACVAIYFLQGLVIVSFYASNVRSRFFKIFLYISIVLFMQFTVPIIAILGFTDLWVDFRRLNRQEKRIIKGV